MSINLNDILNLNNLNKVRIRFNKGNKYNFDPIKHFKEDKQALFNSHFHNYVSRKTYKVNMIVFTSIENLIINAKKEEFADLSKKLDYQKLYMNFDENAEIMVSRFKNSFQMVMKHV